MEREIGTMPADAGWVARLRAAEWLWIPTVAWLVTRVGIAAVAYLSASLMAENPVSPPYHLHGVSNTLLDVFASRWDSGFFLSIAEEGYRYLDTPLPSVPFFPLLPLQMRALEPLVGSHAAAGLLVTNLSLLGAVILLYRLVALEGDRATATRAVWYLLLFPSSLFGSAIYSESLFLIGAIGALYLARRGAWESAALLGPLTALTRLMGIVVAPMLLVEWWQQRRTRGREAAPRWALAAPLAVPLGTLAYMGYLRLVFGDPLAFARASRFWGREPRSPLEMIAPLFAVPEQGWSAALLSGAFPINDWIDLLFVLLFLMAGLWLLRERRWSEATLVILGTLIPLNSGLLASQRRYVWILFPVFMLLARWGRRPWVDRSITVLFTLVLALFVALFANGYWVG